jgi:hypothetical protein
MHFSYSVLTCGIDKISVKRYNINTTPERKNIIFLPIVHVSTTVLM